MRGDDRGDGGTLAPGPRAERVVRWTGVALGAYALAVGVLVMLAWSLGWEGAKDWTRTQITMKGNAGLLGAALGAGVLLMAPARPGRWRGWAAAALGLLAASLAGATLSQHLTGVGLGIDTLLWDEPAGARATAAPGRFGIPAGVCGTLAGIALWLAAVGGARGRAAAAWAGTFVVGWGVLAATGFLYGASTLYSFVGATSISLQMATVMMAVGAGLACLTTEGGPAATLASPGPGGVLARRLTGAAVAVPVLAGWLGLGLVRGGESDAPFALALTALLMSATLAALVLWAGRAVGRSAAARADSAAKLAESEARYRLVARATNDVIWDWDLTTGALAWNESLLSVFGHDPTHVPGTAAWWTAHIHPEDRERVVTRIHAVIDAGGETWRDEYRFARADGTYARVMDRGQVLREGGRPVRMIGSMLDMTERLASSERFERQVRLFEAVTRNTPDFVYLFDTSGRFVYANRRLLEVWGVGLEEAVGRTCLELGYPEWHHDMHMREIAQVIRTRAPIKGEVPFTAPRTGIAGVYEYIFSPVLGPGGEIELIAGTTRDVSERRAAELALRESEERFRALANASSDVLYRMSADWSVMRPLDGRGLVASNDRPLGDWMERNIPADERPRVAGAIRRAVEGRAPFELEHRVVGPDGSERWTFSRAVPILGSRGEIAEWFGAATDITDRKAAEAALMDAAATLTRERERLDLALRTGAMGVYEFLPREGTVWWSRETHALYGTSPGSFTPTPETFMAMVHPEDREELRRRTEESVSRRTLFEMEYRVVDPGGRVRWVFNRSRVSVDSDGRERVTGVAMDVTERVLGERALAESEARLRAFFDSDAVGAIHGHVDGRVLDCNNEYLRIIGRDRADVLAGGVRWDEITPPEWLPRDALAIAEARARGSARPYEKQYARPDGTLVWVLVSFALVGEDRAETVALVMDVTAHKQAEAALRESESFYRQTLESIPGMTFTNTPDGRCDYISSQWEHFTGIPAEALLGDGWTAMIHPDDRDGAFAAWRSAVERGGEYDVEYRVRRRDGAYEWFKVRCQPIRDARGAVARWFGTAVDIQDLREAQAALARHRDELEAEVRRRGEELQRALTQAAMLDRMAAVGTLAAGLGHDIGNLILPMDANAQLLEASDLPPAAREATASIRRSMEYVRSLVRGLRLFTLGPERAAASGRSRTDPEAWAREAGPFLRHAAMSGPGGTAFEIDVEPGTPALGIDPTGLSQAALNLVQNAADALLEEAGRPREPAGADPAPRAVRVRVGPGPEPGRVRVTVEDDGPGMPPDVLARCAEPYFTTKTRGVRTGTGLGLALVHEAVRRAGGRVVIDSAPGRGTRVTLDLPEAPRIDRAGADARPLAVVEVANPTWRRTGADQLAQLGFSVVEAPGPGGAAEDARAIADAEVWVTDRGAGAEEEVAAFVRRRGRGRVVAIGPGARGLEAVGATVVPMTGPPRDFLRAVRAAGAAAPAPDSGAPGPPPAVAAHDGAVRDAVLRGEAAG